MASSMVGTRLQEEIIEKLQKRADAEGKKVSDLVRELIIAGLEKGPGANLDAGAGGILTKLEQLEKRLEPLLGNRPEAEDPPVLYTVLQLEQVEKRILSELKALSKESKNIDKLEKLVIKAMSAALAAQFYARITAAGVNDLTSVWAEDIDVPELLEARKSAAGRMDQDCDDFIRQVSKVL